LFGKKNFISKNPGRIPVVSIFARIGYSKLCTWWLGAIGERQLRCRGANSRSHTRFLFSMPLSKTDTRFGGFRRWYHKLASKNSNQHLMI